jgi:preprotein translocase subunit YajC
MISELSKGDRVITSGGIYGTVMQAKEQTLVLKVADNVKLEVSKSAVVGLQSTAQK